MACWPATRRPRFHRLNPWIDQRHAAIGPAAHAGHAPLWVGLRGMRLAIGRNGKPRKTQATIQIPLQSYA